MDVLLRDVVKLARQAGEAIMTVYASNDPGTVYKDDASPLTKADLASHRLIVDGLRALTPDIPVLSEESQSVAYDERRKWERYWLVDPLDGTKEFLKRRDEFTVNIAMIVQGEPVSGVVYAPALGVTYAGARGAGVIKQQWDQPTTSIRVGDYRTDGLKIVVSRSHAGQPVEELLRRIGAVECVSVGSSLKLCLVADGAAHFYPRLGPTMEWDIAAAQCIVEEAGGTVTDLTGAPLRYNKPDLLNPHFVVCGDPPFPWKEFIWKRRTY